ncbi:MAG: hypothetical protein QG599_160 [Pseudomonadota bacterium]|nr:hypothetical protein [Pseudomonadota bacterium]
MSLRRDYKSRSPRQRRQSVRRHGLLVVTLILVGLFGGLLAYIKGDRAPETPVAAAPPVKPVAPPATPVPSPAPAVAASAPAASEPLKPKYDFYTELPKRQVDIQRAESNPRTN